MNRLEQNPDIKRGISAIESIQDQLKKKSPDELFDVLRVARIRLGDFGIGSAPSVIIAQGKPNINGHWEDKRDKERPWEQKPTAMNCFMNVLASHPHLKELPAEQFSELADTIASIALVNEELVTRTNVGITWDKWPGDLGRDPRVARAENARFADVVKEIPVENKPKFSLIASK
jgi:hypothetical protein